ncbi:hypothetical protein LZ31DRAFT_216970 [Colletotrichum somersetense]|nr:hypothetical protein LZ31DRAFT_216970 [Colletotrichum somersetense]
MTFDGPRRHSIIEAYRRNCYYCLVPAFALSPVLPIASFLRANHSFGMERNEKRSSDEYYVRNSLDPKPDVRTLCLSQIQNFCNRNSRWPSASHLYGCNRKRRCTHAWPRPLAECMAWDSTGPAKPQGTYMHQSLGMSKIELCEFVRRINQR